MRLLAGIAAGDEGNSSSAACEELLGASARTLLVVDDEVEVRRVLADHLQSRGYTVIEAPDGEQALKAIRHKHPNLVLLDIMMPDRMNGLALLQHLWEEHPSVRVVMLSALDDEALSRSTRQMGALAYVRKPFDLDELERIISAALQGTTPAAPVGAQADATPET